MSDPLGSMRYSLQRQIADAQRQLDALEVLPQEDTYPDGAIIRADIRWGTLDPVTYVFFKVELGTRQKVRWYHTGRIDKGVSRQSLPFTYFDGWEPLVRWLGERGRTVESWDVIYPKTAAAGVFLVPQPADELTIYVTQNVEHGVHRMAHWNDLNKRWELR